MNTRRIVPPCLLVAAALALSGCQNVQYQAEEVHRTISFPGFNDEIHATGIEKNGNIRRADTVTHTTSVLGFSRSATYKGAVLEVEPESAADAAPAGSTD